MSRNLISLLSSTVILCAIYTFLPLLGFIAVDLPPKNEFWIKFLSNLGHIPGTTNALIAGAFGAFFQGLIELSNMQKMDITIEKKDRDKFIYFIIIPIAGSISGVIIFFILSSGLINIALEGGSTLNYVKSGDVPLLGYLLWKMRPLTVVDLSKLVVYTFIIGFYYQLIPNILDKLRDSFLNKVPSGK